MVVILLEEMTGVLPSVELSVSLGDWLVYSSIAICSGVLVYLALRTIAEELAERRRVEATLRDSEEHYRAISELMSDHGVALRLEGGTDPAVERVSESLGRISGYGVE